MTDISCFDHLNDDGGGVVGGACYSRPTCIYRRPYGAYTHIRMQTHTLTKTCIAHELTNPH